MSVVADPDMGFAPLRSAYPRATLGPRSRAELLRKLDAEESRVRRELTSPEADWPDLARLASAERSAMPAARDAKRLARILTRFPVRVVSGESLTRVLEVGLLSRQRRGQVTALQWMKSQEDWVAVLCGLPYLRRYVPRIDLGSGRSKALLVFDGAALAARGDARFLPRDSGAIFRDHFPFADWSRRAQRSHPELRGTSLQPSFLAIQRIARSPALMGAVRRGMQRVYECLAHSREDAEALLGALLSEACAARFGADESRPWFEPIWPELSLGGAIEPRQIACVIAHADTLPKHLRRGSSGSPIIERLTGPAPDSPAAVLADHLSGYARISGAETLLSSAVSALRALPS